MMKRRSFLGFLGGAAVAGPKAAGDVATLVPQGLSIPGIGGSTMAMPGATGSSGRSWATEALKRITGQTARERAMRFRRQHAYSIDPNIAACRSISLVNRIRISKRIEFDRSEEIERGYLEGVIAGFWE